MKVISPRVHGMLDYGTILLFALAPTLFDLDGTYATVCYILAAGYLVVTLLTDFPMGMAHLISFPMHGWLELISGIALLAAPFLFGFADDNETARNFFMAMGALFVGSWMLTDWRADTHTQTHGHGTMMPNHH
ncbi:SPW repeat domain-containing protein [Hymenobacter metallicola]|uniref:SPW repeat-containing integral membrane domain-containing protein n=1 Tax=Hymenobacter metallicola TaxID=2563114 RepID=A0A4Z0QB26_9BACT|nr:hypothetical protein [Hymenobacter metallicola]TGE27240.1 hypothetical protein E5K02_12665 [Hymenobacter metallicola]